MKETWGWPASSPAHGSRRPSRHREDRRAAGSHPARCREPRRADRRRDAGRAFQSSCRATPRPHPPTAAVRHHNQLDHDQFPRPQGISATGIAFTAQSPRRSIRPRFRHARAVSASAPTWSSESSRCRRHELRRASRDSNRAALRVRRVIDGDQHVLEREFAVGQRRRRCTGPGPARTGSSLSTTSPSPRPRDRAGAILARRSRPSVATTSRSDADTWSRDSRPRPSAGGR